MLLLLLPLRLFSLRSRLPFTTYLRVYVCGVYVCEQRKWVNVCAHALTNCRLTSPTYNLFPSHFVHSFFTLCLLLPNSCYRSGVQEQLITIALKANAANWKRTQKHINFPPANLMKLKYDTRSLIAIATQIIALNVLQHTFQHSRSLTLLSVHFVAYVWNHFVADWFTIFGFRVGSCFVLSTCLSNICLMCGSGSGFLVFGESGFWLALLLCASRHARNREREKANEGMFVCVRLINVLEFRWVCEPVLIMQTRHTFPYCCGVRERPTTKAVQMFVSMLISGLIGYKTQSQTNACPSHSHSPITES